jgi:AbrB family looped-hinge helix DNA binding protein
MGISHKGGLSMDQQVVFVRDRGRVTIPASVREEYGLEEGTALILTKEKDRLVLYPSREEYVEALLDQVGHALKERGITLKELLEDGEEIRKEVFRERYPELAEKYDL